jgi:hypothetical protein
MHEVQARVLANHVPVKGGDFNSVPTQRVLAQAEQEAAADEP